MKASIVTIGDELLIGQVIDTNSSYIGGVLNTKGFEILEKRAISDTKEAIKSNILELSKTSDICIVTGGLGPTKDDITKKTISELWNDPLEYKPEIGDYISNLLQERGYEISEDHLSQAEVPSTCKYFINKAGTAPGMAMQLNDCWFLFLPGVPAEVYSFFTNDISIWLDSFNSETKIVHKHIFTFKTPESIIANRIQSFEDDLPENFSIAYLPNFMSVRLRLTAVLNKNDEAGFEKLNEKYSELKILVEDISLFNSDKSVVGEVSQLLIQNKLTISTAESCTSGLLASTLSSISGASQYFKGSVVAYDNKIKENVLGVKSSDLINYGAVSKQVVEQMALAVCKIMDTDYSLSTSGIAGPTGGTKEKPVGTIWIGLSNGKQVWSECIQLRSTRSLNIEQTVTFSLIMLLKKITE